MPELPEVETIRRDLATCLLNRKIAQVIILSPKIAPHSAAYFRKELVGRKIIVIGRRGKLLIFRLLPQKEMAGRKNAVDYLLIHLKMTGQLIYLDKKNRVAGGHSLNTKVETQKLPNSHTRAYLAMDNGGHLYFNDMRKFGYWKLSTKAELDRLLEKNYGPEPLTPEFTIESFKQSLSRTNLKIKAALLNQKLIAGLGNIYVDEVLWKAGIRPERPVKDIAPEEFKKLFKAINQIIALAIEQRGTTFSDYVDSRGQSGYFSKFLKVYGRSGEKCPKCGQLIQKTKIAGRGTHYCPVCQK